MSRLLLSAVVMLALSACATTDPKRAYCREKMRKTTIEREHAEAALEKVSKAAEAIATPSAYADVAAYAADVARAAADETAAREECARLR